MAERRGRPGRPAAAALVVLLAVAAAVAAWHWFGPQAGAFDMRTELARLAAQEGVWDNQWNRHADKAAQLGNELDATQRTAERIELRRRIAEQHFFAGHPEAAIAELEQLLEQTGGTVPPGYSRILREQLALAYLRMGELNNCLWNHNADACLFPLSGDGVHRQRLGAAQAAELLTRLLAEPGLRPDEVLRYRWLLNIAYMALGEYPEGVPGELAIGPERFASEVDIARFPDVAPAKGVSVLGLSGGAIMDDFNNDGRLDIMASSFGLTDPLELFINNGEGGFFRSSSRAGLDGLTGGLNIKQADYDNDGDLDVFVMRGAWLHRHGQHPNSLLRNNGDGTFTDVTARAGLLTFYPTQTACWADIDGDGWLDLFVGNEIVRSQVDWPEEAPSFELYHNNGDGSFAEVGARSGIALAGMIKGCAFGDFDNDRRPDLYVSIWGRPNHLFRNVGQGRGELRFADVTADAGVAEPQASFPTWFWDYDNDGWLDLFVSGYRGTIADVARDYLDEPGEGARPRLYRNNGDGSFSDVAAEAGIDHVLLTMGSNYGDLDNDGWLDFYAGTGSPPFSELMPNRMYRNAAGRRFQDVTTSGGFGHLQKGHGVAFGDYDGDGDQDIYAVIGGAYASDVFWNVLYENPGHGHNWVTLRLRGESANRSAIGARVRIRVPAGNATQDFHHLVGSGSSFGGNSLQLEAGIGTAPRIDEIEILWPDQSDPQVIAGPIAPNATYLIRQGQAGLQRLEPGAGAP